MRKLLARVRAKAGAELPVVVEDLIVRCLDLQAERRPTMHQVVEALAMLERALDLPSLASGELPWGPRSAGADPFQVARSAPSAVTGPGSTSQSVPTPHRGMIALLLFLTIVLAAGAATTLWFWKNGLPAPVAANTQPEPAEYAEGLGSASTGAEQAEPTLSVSTAPSAVSAPTPPKTPPKALPTIPPHTSPPSASAPAASSATKPPLPSMRLAAIASLEDRAEEADRKNNPALAKQLRGMADKHLDDVERIATEMKTKEPADAASLLDYVSKARTYLRQRRTASRAP